MTSAWATRISGHAVGMLCAVAAIVHAPRVMSAVECSLSRLGLVAVQGGCATGVPGLGEGGLSFEWSMAPYLVGLVLIMEAALWLQRLYSAPTWLPPVVVVLGCPALLGAIVGLNAGPPWFEWDVGVVMGLPVALAFTAYWSPLRLLQAHGVNTTPRSCELQGNDLKAT